MSRTFVIITLSIASFAIAPRVLAQEAPADPKPTAPAPFRLTEAEQERVLDLFQATGEEIDGEGRISLSYDFERREVETATDWIPPLDRKKPNVRFAKDWEGAQNGTDGILIADSGQWFHRAVFAQEASIEIDFMSLCGGSKGGDVVAATYAWSSKLKKRVGCNLGDQIVKLSGTKVAGGVGKAPLIYFEEPVNFGFVLKDGTFQARKSGSDRQSTDSSKFLKKLGPGQVGLVWRGKISAAIPKVTVEGLLDIDWIGKRIPEIGKRLAEHRKAAEGVKKGSH